MSLMAVASCTPHQLDSRSVTFFKYKQIKSAILLISAQVSRALFAYLGFEFSLLLP